MSKCLTVYVGDSYYKYPHLFSQYIYAIDSDHSLSIFQRSQIDGEENLIACFRQWDYFRIDEQ